jgi:hypothetical protein
MMCDEYADKTMRRKEISKNNKTIKVEANGAAYLC